MSLSGHLWTVAPRIGRKFHAPASRPWSTQVQDLKYGSIRLTGLLREEPESEVLLLLVHGIGGSADATYLSGMAHVAAAAGLSCLRMNLRGCDRLGEDYYHAGLSSDLGAVLAAPDLAAYRRVIVIGFSMGGHLALHYAATRDDPRLAAVVGVCPPVDLRAAGAVIDEPSRWLYRHYVLRNLMGIYAEVAARRAVPVPFAEARHFTHLRQWDGFIVAPRWGFAGADDYYCQASVAPYLGQIRVPALVVISEQDPMVPPRAVLPALAEAGPTLTLRRTKRGGHVSFPADLDLGFPAARGVEGQVLGWCREQLGSELIPPDRVSGAELSPAEFLSALPQEISTP